jgi:undecaprenyl-diphosphatase
MQLSFWQMLILAVVQGITEFLPVSSSGHLVVVSHWLAPGEDLDQFVELNVVLHLGTLGSIVVYYWRHLVRLLGEDRRILGLIAIGTAPAVAIGLPLRLFGKDLLASPSLTGAMLLVTGGLLLLASRFTARQSEEYQRLSPWQALWIGLAQACALLPGISRSGTTISTGLLTGLSPRAATAFSFLLALPAIGGAGVLEVAKMAAGRAPASSLPMSWLAIGALVSFGVGLGAIAILVRMLERNRLHWFAWWCIPLGLLVLAWQWTGGN